MKFFKTILNLFIIFLIFLFFTKNSNAQYDNFIQQIGSNEDNLFENSISVNKINPQIIITQHNSLSGNGGSVTYTKSFISSDGGHTWNIWGNQSNSWCNPSVNVSNNQNMYFSYIASPNMSQGNDYIDITTIRRDLIIDGPFLDKPYIWSDNYNNLFCAFQKTVEDGLLTTGFYVYELPLGSNWQQIFYQQNKDGFSSNFDTGIRGVCDNNGCIYLCWNTGNACYFARACLNFNPNWFINQVSSNFVTFRIETPNIAINRNTGTIYISYTEKNTISNYGDYGKAKCFYSTNNGNTWPVLYLNNQNDHDQRYTWVASESKDQFNLVAAVYYNISFDNTSKKIEVAYTTDDGIIWNLYNNINLNNNIYNCNSGLEYIGMDLYIDDNNRPPTYMFLPVYSDCSESNYLSFIAPFSISGFNDKNNNDKNKENVLFQNSPNPFNPITSIKYRIKEATFVKIQVYDILGKLIKTLLQEEKTPGEYSVVFDAANISSGIYLYKIETKSYTEIKRMVVIK
jgi:hypothetical protein